MQTVQLKDIDTKDRDGAQRTEAACIELNELQLSLIGGGNADISLN
jgi:hypothetical protein